tara:strand:- start:1522 stop:2070 length:549 start_codon:yes stop_codon:yes gene_type:complete
MENNFLGCGFEISLDTIIAGCAFIASLTSLGLSVHFWRRSFRPIVSVAVRTYSVGSIAMTFDLEVLNSGSLPAKNIRLKIKNADLKHAFGHDASDENKRRWLSCFAPCNVISILHNNQKTRCSFGTSREGGNGFWKYKSKFPVIVEYEGWYGKKYSQIQEIQITSSESFTGFLWNKSNSGLA